MPTESPNTPLLIFDGDCGFCTTSAQWVEHRLPATAHVEPWQRLDLAPLGLTEQDVTVAAYWVDERGRTYRGDAAIAKSLVAIGGVWKPIGWLLQVPPISLLAAVGYKLVARYRYKLPGGTPACKAPRR